MRKNRGWGLLFGVLGIGLIAFIATRNSQNAGSAKASRWVPVGQKSYDNEEIREIEYNNEGLPKRITIHRHAIVT